MRRISGVGVLDKAFSVLDAIEASPRHLTELQSATGLSRATAHRLAVALEVHGFVARDGGGRFVLGHRLTLVDFPALARPGLEQLRDATGESVQLYVRRGDNRVCVASLESPYGLRTIVPVGAFLPLVAGSAGKVLRGDPATVRRGWADSVEERERGVASVSAPVRDPRGEVVAAVSVSGPIERTSRTPGRRYADAVLAAAATIGAALPYPAGEVDTA